jgi:hypothetical protein
VKEVTEAAVANGYSVMITADHGNADYAINPDGSPNTAHSLNPVPCFLIDKEYKKINDSSYTYLNQRCRIVDSKNTPQSFDYTVIYCWAKFTPRITKDLFNRFNTIKQSKKYNILFISLNKDWQKGTFDTVPPISAKVKRNGRALDRKD